NNEPVLIGRTALEGRPTNKDRRRGGTMSILDFFVFSTVNVILIGSVVVFGGAAVFALSWAVRDGQFQNFERGARSIFDPAEPIGEATDRFPDSAEMEMKNGGS
ncbi:MAG: cbb3-type cytochrome oxidase assembly protein, partial [Planctomycetes bacterium]|nr:cbb3-type cytochrome oxidase assembly protein [Planctomycetota bacterium]